MMSRLCIFNEHNTVVTDLADEFKEVETAGCLTRHAKVNKQLDGAHSDLHVRLSLNVGKVVEYHCLNKVILKSCELSK